MEDHPHNSNVASQQESYEGVIYKNIQYRWDPISWCVGIILQRELRTPGVISLCHKMTLHMSVSHCMTWIKHWQIHFIILLFNSAFITQIQIYPMNTTGDMYYIMGGSPFSTTQGFSKYMHSISMRPYCMVYGSHFPTRGKHSQSYFFTSYTSSPYACVGLIEQREISTPRVISLYHIMTPHKSAWGHRTTWSEHSRSYFIIIWYLCHRCHRFSWPTEDIIQLKIRASRVMSLYNRISPRGSE